MCPMGAEAAALLAPEAERLINSLKAWGVELVGSPKWIQQQEALQRLNAQVSWIRDFPTSFRETVRA